MTQRRADAVQNRAKLLEAAEAIFLELGLNAPLDAIAERAGVGRATLFRNFADRRSLILGLIDRGLEEIESEAARLAGDAGALARLLRFMADRIIFHAPLIEYWQALDHDSPEFLTTLRRLLAVFEKPVEWAVADGSCRSDLVPSDALLLMSMLSGALYARIPDQRRQLADRAWVLVVEMAQLRGTGSSPVPRR